MKKIILAAFLVLISVTISNAALFTGETVRVEYFFPGQVVWSGNTQDVVVGSGVELSGFPVGDPRTNIDISDTINNIYITYNSAGSWSADVFNGLHFQDILSSIDPFTGIQINAATNLVGFGLSNITFDDNNIYVDWNGLSFNADTIVSFNINSAAVPEPTTLILLGAGLIGLAGYSRKRN